MWWGDVAHDQRPTDAYSLVYDTEPLSQQVEILGLPRAILQVASDATRANWFVRISDVAPDGTVTQVAGAGFNGTHRASAREPRALVPGEMFPLEIEMHFTSWVFSTGHRIRFANFYYRYTRRLMENGKPVRERTWSETIPRDFQ